MDPQERLDDSDSDEEITVLVTGFGAFQENPFNPSYAIAKSLPRTITIPPSARGPSRPTTVTLLHLPGPVRTAWHFALTLITNVLRTFSPDLVLHIGVAPSRTGYTIERGAERLSRGGPDENGRRWAPSDADATWPPDDGYPERLQTGLDIDNVWARWKDGCRRLGGVEPDEAGAGAGAGAGAEASTAAGGDAQPQHTNEGQQGVTRIGLSDRAGSYLCCFVYYLSLAWYWAMERDGQTSENGHVAVERPVLFLHVPPCTEADVQKGRDVAEQLIRAMVGSWLEQQYLAMRSVPRGI